jgi:glycosyltransferase involved in cell wall biosynthesis
MRVSVVVPCYNEEDNLQELHRRVSLTCSEVVGTEYEIILVNDGSKDKTRDRIVALCSRDQHVVLVDLSRNYGHQIALSAGLEFCRGERILILDADLQDPPELLGEMMARIDDGFDVVYGQRDRREGETVFKRLSASLFYRVLGRLADIDIAADTGDFRLMSRRVLDHLNAMPERYRFIRGMVSWIGFSQVAVRYTRNPRFAGQTKYPVRKMISFATDAITSFSIVPLRMASHLGLAFGALGLLALGWTLISWIAGETIQGWASIASVVLILGSVQLFVLGIFGEYLGRMYMETKGRPLYVVREVVTSQAMVSPAHEPDIKELHDMVRRASRA